MKDDDTSFNVAFVRQVRQFPVLYDHTALCSKEEKELAWQAIADHFHETVGNCVERWRNIRTSMGRSLKHSFERTSSNRHFRKPYYLAKYLDFLVPFMSHRERRTMPLRHVDSGTVRLVTAAEDDADDEDEEEGDPLYEEPTNSPIEVKPLMSSPSDEMLLQALRAGQERRPAAKRHASSPTPSPDASTHDIDAEPVTVIVAGDEEPPATKRSHPGDPDDDADWAFLRSLLPDLRAMGPADKLAFKISVLSAINSLLYAKTA